MNLQACTLKLNCLNLLVGKTNTARLPLVWHTAAFMSKVLDRQTAVYRSLMLNGQIQLHFDLKSFMADLRERYAALIQAGSCSFGC